MHIDLIEVKSGNDYKKHSALDKVMTVNEWKFDKKYVFCKVNIEHDNDIFYFPWYMIIFYKHDEVPTDMKFEVDLSGLA